MLLAKEILQRCLNCFSAVAYAQAVVNEIRDVTRSRICIWCDADLELVALTEGAQPYLKQVQAYCGNLRDGGSMIAAVPILFRGQTLGFLAIAGCQQGYDTDTLELLTTLGRPVWMQHQSLVAQEALGARIEPTTISRLAHDLRQPLCSIEACAYYLGLVAKNEDPGRLQIQMITEEVERANLLITEMLERTTGASAAKIAAGAGV